MTYCHKCDINFFGGYCPICGNDYTWDIGNDDDVWVDDTEDWGDVE